MSGGFDSRKDSHNRVYITESHSHYRVITESTLQIHNIHYRYTTDSHNRIYITESHRHHMVIAESTLKIHITRVYINVSKKEYHQLKKSAVCVFVVCCVSFLKNNQKGEHKPRCWIASSIDYFKPLKC